MWCKVMVESVLFLANFAIQRDFIFVKRPITEATTEPVRPDAYVETLSLRADVKTAPAPINALADSDPQSIR